MIHTFSEEEDIYVYCCVSVCIDICRRLLVLIKLLAHNKEFVNTPNEIYFINSYCNLYIAQLYYKYTEEYCHDIRYSYIINRNTRRLLHVLEYT